MIAAARSDGRECLTGDASRPEKSRLPCTVAEQGGQYYSRTM
jgi:hypothetical protein